jgi:hypothetical protein
MRLLLMALLAACTHGSTPATRTGGDTGVITHESLAGDDDYQPSYGKPELEKALIAERAAEATDEKNAADPEGSGGQDAAADLAVRRRFIASLEACQASGHTCPPRLDDPAWSYDPASNVDPRLDAPLRFDLEDWQKMAAELHGRACACRTVSCVDSMEVAIAHLEPRPMQDVRGDATASLSITRARECLMRLGGKARTYPAE